MIAKTEKTEAATKPTGLALLRAPFPANAVSKLPKPTKDQTDEVRQNFKAGIRCVECGQWHHPKVVHLDYVGHAAMTDRLLDCDPAWNWEPVALAEDGAPKLDSEGGMWIRLTVCNVTRLGYGFPDGKKGGNAIKETIGDALRNAAMRFGAALDLWHKGELHPEVAEVVPAKDKPPADEPSDITADLEKVSSITDQDELDSYFKTVRELTPALAKRADFIAACKAQRAVIAANEMPV